VADGDPYRFQLFYGPEGRMTLVDRALEAVGKGAISIGLRFPSYAVIASMVRPTRRLMEPSEKVFKVDGHVGVTGSGYISDLRKLVDQMRIEAQRHRLVYGTPIDVASLVGHAGQYLHAYTLYPVRPQGVAAIIAGVDKLGVQLHQVDPSGTSFRGDAFALGQGADKAIEEIENNYSADLKLEEAFQLIAKVMEKSGAPEPLIQYGYVDVSTQAFVKQNH